MARDGSAEVFAAMARLLEAEPDLAATASQICQLARDGLSCDYAGITLLHGRSRVETVAATDPVVEKADALQYELNEGPCLQAIWSQSSFVAEDLRDEDRWPRWAQAVVQLELRSILAVRLFTSDTTYGALNLYSRELRNYTTEDVALAQIYATHASVALAAAREEEQLRAAIDSRHLIGLAQGILMERFDIGVDRSFEVLRRYSQTRNLKLRAIAEEIVERRGLRLDA